MLASGFAGLGYQMVWTSQAGILLGHEAAAVLAVVAAFFGGLGLGAALLAPVVERSRQPWRWYLGLELGIGAWALLLGQLLEPAGALLQQAIGVVASPWRQWGLSLGGVLLLLLPATAAMGVTLPAMDRLLRDDLRPADAAAGRGASDGAGGGRAAVTTNGPVAGLYAANTAGAVLGVLVCTFWLVPAWGFRSTAWLCAGLNLGCAGLAWWRWGRGARAAVVPGPVAGAATAPGATLASVPASVPAARLLGLLAATGLLGIGLEVLVVRMLSQLAENTVYTYALLLAIYLVGTALGAALWQRWGARWQRRQAAPAAALLGWAALASAVGVLSLWAAQPVLQAAQAWWADGARDAMAAALAAEAMPALLAFGLPTLAMGALFSHLAQQAQARGLGLGWVLGVNTAGAALAPLLCGVWLLPTVGAKPALLLLVAGYALLGLLAARDARAPGGARVPVGRGEARPGWPLPLAALLLVLAAAALAPPLRWTDLPSGARLLQWSDGAMATVSVVEDAQGVRRLQINNRQQEGDNISRWVDGRQALLPLALHAAPRRALLLGLGTGTTARSAALDGGLQQVDVVELLPEVIAAAPLFQAEDEASLAARLRLHAADARRFVRSAGVAYDLIVSDNFHPARSGSAALYTVEHFRAVRQRLAPGGVFCQWLPLHQMDIATLRSIVQAFRQVYPQGGALLASYSLATPVLGLLARVDAAGADAPPALPAAVLTQRLQDPRWRRPPADYGLADAWAVLGSLVADAPALAQLAAQVPANTDDRPLVAHLAPRATYAPQDSPAQRLLALTERWQAGSAARPAALLGADALRAEPAQAARLQAYWLARDRYLQAGTRVRPSADVHQMLAQVREPLLALLRLSPDFRPAYDPLLQMADALAATSPDEARALLQALQQAQPARPEAAARLVRLDAGG